MRYSDISPYQGMLPSNFHVAAYCAPTRSMLMTGVFADRSKLVHPMDQPNGYEAAGGAAVYLGDNKLVRSAPPYGDGKWRLYDIAKNPTEAKDLSQAEPKLAQQMLADYAAYVRRNGVVAVPPDHDVIKQAQANAASNNQCGPA